MDRTIGNLNIIVIAIGLLSSVVDNVPLVAAAMGMYDMQTFPTDHYFWEFIAYCAGTGGSCLIIGSAAGVAAMGMEKIDFFWYLKKISLLALSGYLAGAFTYMAQQYFLG
jgi:Na+/H+ antiporter NhaD/arsenite permease-like protein